MFKTKSFAAGASALAIGLGAVATAAFAAEGDVNVAPDRGVPERAEIGVLEREGEELTRAIEEHRIDELSGRYRDLYAQAEKLDAEPKTSLLAKGDPRLGELADAVAGLRKDVEDARKADDSAGGGDFALAGGVSQATLDAIAACESGGDPAAVNAAGYYGKYQFDLGTWQSVGGSGNPAEAPEAEQDMRASMLYARAGSSPWPVCGQ